MQPKQERPKICGSAKGKRLTLCRVVSAAVILLFTAIGTIPNWDATADDQLHRWFSNYL